MLDSKDEWIRKRAYAIWEEEGYPSGRDTVHWEQANSERIALEKSAKKTGAKNGKTKVKDSKTDEKPEVRRKASVVVAVAGDAMTKVAAKRTSKKAAEAKI